MKIINPLIFINHGIIKKRIRNKQKSVNVNAQKIRIRAKARVKKTRPKDEAKKEVKKRVFMKCIATMDSPTSNESLVDIEINTPPISIVEPSIEQTIVVPEQAKDNQDFNQKVGVTITVLLELYRVLIASFLILFVPQTCGDHICSISENAETGDDPLYNAGFSFNCITLIAFLAMYFSEIKREGKLIAYLDVNPKCKTDNDSVGEVLARLPEQRKTTILFYDSLYQKTGYFALTCFVTNTVLSGFVVYKYYLDDKTTSTFITSVLFMITKMADVYSTVKTEKNILYSAYLKGKVQYNDLDADKGI
jgi:hypothetical protein